MRKCRNKGKSHRRSNNNNNVVIKHGQGPLVPSQAPWIIFWPIACELSYRCWGPHGWKKLTAPWPDCSHDMSGHNSKNWPQGIGKKLTLELKIYWIWNNQDDACQTSTWPTSGWLSELTAVSAGSPSLSLWWFLPPACRWRAVSLWTDVCPSSPAASVWSKANLPPALPVHWLLSTKEPDPTPFSNDTAGIRQYGAS